MKKELLKGFSEEQIKKAELCKSNEEILALAKKEGVELTDEQLAAISGGCSEEELIDGCPMCHSALIKIEMIDDFTQRCTCHKCGYTWDIKVAG